MMHGLAVLLTRQFFFFFNNSFHLYFFSLVNLENDALY